MSGKSGGRQFKLYLIEGYINDEPKYKYIASFKYRDKLCEKVLYKRNKIQDYAVVDLNTYRQAKVSFPPRVARRLLNNPQLLAA